MDKNVKEAIETLKAWAAEGEPFTPKETELSDLYEGEKPNAIEVRELCQELLRAACCDGMGGCRLCCS